MQTFYAANRPSPRLQFLERMGHVRFIEEVPAELRERCGWSADPRSQRFGEDRRMVLAARRRCVGWVRQAVVRPKKAELKATPNLRRANAITASAFFRAHRPARTGPGSSPPSSGPPRPGLRGALIDLHTATEGVDRPRSTYSHRAQLRAMANSRSTSATTVSGARKVWPTPGTVSARGG